MDCTNGKRMVHPRLLGPKFPMQVGGGAVNVPTGPPPSNSIPIVDECGAKDVSCGDTQPAQTMTIFV